MSVEAPAARIVEAAIGQVAQAVAGVDPGGGARRGHEERGPGGPCGRACAGGAVHGADVAETWFDLASLTKVLFTTPAILDLVAQGRIGLDDGLTAAIPDLRQYDADAPERRLTVRQCLAHQTHLPAVEPLYTYGQDPATLRAFVLQRVWRSGPAVYSDINFILLGIAIERLTGSPLIDRPVRPGLSFRPDPEQAAATERCTWRGRVMRGEVHDENAFALGGAAGHAGLFGTVDGVLDAAQEMLGGANAGAGRHARPGLRHADAGVGGAARGLAGRRHVLGRDARAHGLHRDGAVDRLRARPGLDAAHQPRAPDPAPRHRHRRAAPPGGRPDHRSGSHEDIGPVGTALVLGAGAQAASPEDLVRAYPEALSGFDGTNLIWRDGTRMPVGPLHPGRTAEDAGAASILDQLALRYTPGGTLPPLDDPGRTRNQAFFDKMYGDCRSGQVAPRLVQITWLPKSWGHAVSISPVNGLDRSLEAVSRELDELPPQFKRYLYPLGGTYNCRRIAGSAQTSMHSWGAAIDLNTAYSDYWRWSPSGAYRNRMPPEIVAIFERHGFIWGGRWAHFDTMHFEYRPELLGPPQRIAAPPRAGHGPGLPAWPACHYARRVRSPHAGSTTRLQRMESAPCAPPSTATAAVERDSATVAWARGRRR